MAVKLPAETRGGGGASNAYPSIDSYLGWMDGLLTTGDQLLFF